MKQHVIRTTVFTTVLMVLAVGVPVQAQSGKNGDNLHYRWHSDTGVVQYSDTLTADALKNGYEVINNRGLVVQQVDRQPTAAERAAAKQQAEQQAQQQRRAAERARQDAQLLAAYPTEAAYRAWQQQSLDNIDQQIQAMRINLHNQEKTLADLLSHAGDLERAKQPVPKLLSDTISQQRNVVAHLRSLMQTQQAARQAAEQKNAQDLQYYLAIKAAQDTAPQ